MELYSSLVIWMALPVLGCAVVDRLAPRLLSAGWLAGLAVGGVAGAALLAPLTVAGYLLGWPAWTVAVALGVGALAGAADLARRRRWRLWFRDLRRTPVLVAALVGLSFMATLRVGAPLDRDEIAAGRGYDSVLHVGRIRHLAEQGLNNRDFSVAEPHFFPVYHTNLHHALHAAAVNTLPGTPLDVWFTSAAPLQVAAVAAFGFAAWCVGKRRRYVWVGLAAGVAVVGWRTFANLPNQTAAFTLAPMAVGLTCLLWRSGSPKMRWTAAAGLAAVSMATALTHGLYSVFLVIQLGPVLALAAALAAYRRFKHRPTAGAPPRGAFDARASLAAAAPAIAAGAALLVGLVSPVVSRATMPPLAPGEVLGRGNVEPEFLLETIGGLVIRNPETGVLRDFALRPALVVAGVALAWFLARRVRRGLTPLVAIYLAGLAVLYVPFLATPVLEALGREWMLDRFEELRSPLRAIALSVGLAAARWWTARRFMSGRPGRAGVTTGTTSGPRRQPRRAARLAACLAVVAVLVSLGSWRPWSLLLQHAAQPAAVRIGSTLEPKRQWRDELDRRLPDDAVVAAPEWLASLITMVHPATVVSPRTGANGVTDRAERRLANVVIGNASFPWLERREAIRRFGVTHAVQPIARRPIRFGRAAERLGSNALYAFVELLPESQPIDDAIVAFERGEHERAAALFETLILAAGGANAAALDVVATSADAHASIGERAVAERRYVQAIRAAPADAFLRTRYAALLTARGDAERALRQLGRVEPAARSSADPTFRAIVFTEIARALAATGDRSRAVDAARAAIAAEPEYAPARRLLDRLDRRR